MAYSKEVKENVLHRIKIGEKIADISKDTGITATTIYRWKENEDEEKRKFEKAKKASEQIKELIEQGELEKAEGLCGKFPDNLIIQSQHVNILIKIGTKESLEEATEICEKCLQNKNISMKQKEIFEKQYANAQLKKISILVKEDFEGAIEMCERFLQNEDISMKQKELFKRQYISAHLNLIEMLRREGKSEEAIEVTEKFPENSFVQSQRVALLIKKGTKESKEEAIEIMEKFPEDPVIQSQHVKILIKIGTKESLKKVKEICENFLQNEIFQRQYEKAQERLKLISENSFEVAKSDEKRDKSALDRIKTKLYYDDVDFGFIEQIKQNEELSNWERTVALVAIYDKQKSPKSAEKILKESKKALKARIEQALLREEQPSKEDTEKVKILNKLQNMATSKKSRAFDWSIYDEILGWQLDEKVHQEIIKKREAEKAEQVAKQEKVERQIAQVEKKKPKSQISAKVIEKPMAKAPIVVSQKQEPKKPKVKKEKKQKDKPKSDSSIATIGQEFEEELLKLRVNIMLRQNSMEFEDERLRVPNDGDFKRYHVPQEAFNALKAKFAKQKKMDDDQDSVDKMTTKSVSNVRAKMQLVCLLKKYGMGNVAEQKLPLETKKVNKLIQDFRRMDQETKLAEQDLEEGEEK